MRKALALAAQGRGHVEPNPMVGAVVLDSAGQLAGEGWHKKFGEAHAEVHALNAAGERANGGTLVVTLEPCCHWGKTPPCTDAILRAGIKRVALSMVDPFPQVAGIGIALLKTAGVEVHIGLCEAEARALNAPYLKLLRTGRPWVHAKWAMSLDGKIATRTSDSQWISGDESQKRVHELRGRMDAVVIGRGTMVADDPLLTARPPGPRLAARVVLSATGELPERCRLRMTARKTPVILFTLAANAHRLQGWTEDGAEVVAVDDNALTLDAVLNEFGRRRFTNVMFEGGSALFGSLIDAGLADEFHVFIAPKLIGGTNALSPVGGAGTDRMIDALSLHRVSVEKLGDDAYMRGFSAK